MKKYFYSVLAVATMLFATTSCSSDDVLTSEEGLSTKKVTFKVKVPGVAQSRAIDAEGNEVGAGKYADKLVYAMYEEDQNEILVAGFASDDDKNGTFEVDVPMAKDIKYDILFLAYNEANSAFVINNNDAKLNNLKAVQMKTNLSANQEAYDAFIGRVDSKGVDAAATTTVTLKRPFAQVNAATTYDDLNTAKVLKAEVATSKFVIYNAPNTLNVFTGEVSGNETFTYEQTEILKEFGKTEYPFNEKIKIGEDTYYYLAMAYVLAGAESSTHDADFSFYRADDKLVSSLSVLSLPTRANYRTNVLGTLLTQVENYEIKIDAVFGEPANAPEEEQTEKIVVSTAEDLKAAIASAVNSQGENRAIGHDIKYTMIELQPGTYTGAFDIAGKNVILMSNDKENTIIDGLVHGWERSHIVLRNLTLTNATPASSASDRHNADGYCLGSYVVNWVIENCTFNVSAGTPGAINVYSNLNDFTTSTIEGVNYDLVIKNSTFNCNGERPIRGKTNSYIEGCTFNNQHRYAIQVQGNEQLTDPETVTFINNKIVNPCQTSGEAFAAAVSISKSQLLENVTFNISGNTIEGSAFELKNLVYDINDNVKITTCTLNGAQITAFECKAIEGVTDAKEVVFTDGVVLTNGEYLISNANGMIWFANEVNAKNNSFNGKTVKLTADIDLENIAWTPVGQTGATQFKGTFDGQNNTISNLGIDKTTETGGNYSSGLFGWLNAATVMNVTVTDATVKGNHNVGVIAGYLETAYCTIENCHVSGATVECHVANADANGDKAGVIVGHAGNEGVVVNNCTAKNSTVSAGRDAGQIAGAAKEANVTNCSATNVTVTANGEGTGANVRNEVIGRVL